jgi:hypothetical protein
VKITTKKPKPIFDEPLAKYKKGYAHTKSRQNWIVQKIKPELPVSPHQADVSVAGRCGDSKQLKPSSWLSCLVRIGELENSMQQCHFPLLDIKCPNPEDLHL